MQKPDCYQTDLLDIRNKNAQHKLSKWQFIQCTSIILLVHWKDAQAMREKEINGKKDYHSKISFFTYGRLRGLPQVYLTGTPHTVQGGYHQDEKKRLVWFFCCGFSMLHSVKPRGKIMFIELQQGFVININTFKREKALLQHNNHVSIIFSTGIMVSWNIEN